MNDQRTVFFKRVPNNNRYPIPRLPVLDALVEATLQNNILPDLSGTIIVGVQHLLETTASLFESLIKLGIKPENMYFTGKCYSTSLVIETEIEKLGLNLIQDRKPQKLGIFKETLCEQLEELWDKVMQDLNHKQIDRIILLDDGGRCLETIPSILYFKYRIVGIEQTPGGLYSPTINHLPFRLIEVASSAAKKYLESPFIAEAVLKRVKSYLITHQKYPNKDILCGVVGNGAIGMALINYLLSVGYKVAIYDQDPTATKIVHPNLRQFPTIKSLIANSDWIFGCTGTDITANFDVIELSVKNKHFISCTSEDKEFLTLLRNLEKKVEAKIDNDINIKIIVDVLSDVTYRADKSTTITIVKGGFPINFDGSPWNVPANDIAITQGLLLGSCIQAIKQSEEPFNPNAKVVVGEQMRLSLDPFIQSFIVNQWLPSQPPERYSTEVKQIFNNIEWISKNSGGVYDENPIITQCFSQTQNVQRIAKL